MKLFKYFIIDCSELKKLSEESLARPPEEVFDIIFKLGEGSYGSVFKAIHKESGVVSEYVVHFMYIFYEFI